MLSRSNRLSTQQLSDIMARGKISHSPFFLMRTLSIPENKDSHVAAVAPQKIFKTAVARNRMRRRIYEAVRPLVADIKGTVMLALFAKSTAQECKPTDLRNDLRDLFVKAGIVR